MEKQKIFFSYSRVDADLFALKLAADLQKAGANLWVDQLNIELGKLWDEEVEKALDSADCVLFIATEKSTTSNNVLDEVYYAMEEKKQVIPVIATKCTLPFRLKRLQYIDFTVNYEASLERLLGALHLKTNIDQLVVVMTQTESLDYQVGEEEQFWKHVQGRNNLFSYEDYLSAYPVGKYSTSAAQKIKELQGLNAPKQVIKSRQPDPKVDTKSPSAANKKWMLVIIASIVIIALIWYLSGGKPEKTADNPSNLSMQDSSDSVKNRNKENAEACIKALVSGNVDAYLSFFSPAVVEYGDGSTDPSKGVEALRKNIDSFLLKYPELKADGIKAVAEADSVKVSAHWSWAPTNDQQGSSNDIDYYKFDSSGKIISHRNTSSADNAK